MKRKIQSKQEEECERPDTVTDLNAENRIIAIKEGSNGSTPKVQHSFPIHNLARTQLKGVNLHYSSSLSLLKTDATATFGFFAALPTNFLEVPPFEENPNFNAFRCS